MESLTVYQFRSNPLLKFIPVESPLGYNYKMGVWFMIKDGQVFEPRKVKLTNFELERGWVPVE